MGQTLLDPVEVEANFVELRDATQSFPEDRG
ncbi:hypothetical protein J2W43_001285 [Pseudomonas brassicacearum]|uniref:Uncharacterized protein n=1 Tax=Pseudomonas brassicacearum TaxID=930166 RepID=A0AAW8M6B8_9PSED|nr:hypothetical protein [Pseudomonas brassicacearum]